MSLQDILKKILDQAAVEIKAIEKETAEKKKELEAQSSEIEATEMAQLEERTAEALESVTTKAESMARREKAKKISHVKKDLVHEAMEKFVEHLNKLDDKTYEGILAALVDQIDEKSGTLEVPKGKSGLVQSSKFQVSEAADVSGGFRFKNDRVVIDNTFESLVFSQFRSELEIYFAEQLKLV